MEEIKRQGARIFSAWGLNCDQMIPLCDGFEIALCSLSFPPSVLRDPINLTVSAAATVIEIRSAAGAANKIPSIPKNFGNIIISGIKQIMSLIIEAAIACMGLPAA